MIAPSHVRRLEAGILSYGQDMDIENNPFEVRLGWQVDPDKGDYIGKDALARIKAEGVRQRLVGLRLGGEPIVWYNEDFYLVKDDASGADVGYVTSAFWSPNLESNIALAVMPPHPLAARNARQGATPRRRHRGRRSGASAVQSTPAKDIPKDEAHGRCGVEPLARIRHQLRTSIGVSSLISLMDHSKSRRAGASTPDRERTANRRQAMERPAC